MWYLQIPAPVDLTLITGEPVPTEDGEQARATFEQFLLGRLTDPACLESPKIEGIAAMLWIVETRERIKAEIALRDGWMALEDEQHKRLLASITTPKSPFRQELVHNFATFMLAVHDAKKEAPECRRPAQQEPAAAAEEPAAESN